MRHTRDIAVAQLIESKRAASEKDQSVQVSGHDALGSAQLIVDELCVDACVAFLRWLETVAYKCGDEKKEGAPQRTLGAPHGDGEHFMSVRVNINRVDVSEILQVVSFSV